MYEKKTLRQMWRFFSKNFSKRGKVKLFHQTNNNPTNKTRKTYFFSISNILYILKIEIDCLKRVFE